MNIHTNTLGLSRRQAVIRFRSGQSMKLAIAPKVERSKLLFNLSNSSADNNGQVCREIDAYMGSRLSKSTKITVAK
jgi:hypothetical protein